RGAGRQRRCAAPLRDARLRRDRRAQGLLPTRQCGRHRDEVRDSRTRDPSGIGIVRGRELLANVIASSMEEHARYGGVVPEIAARAHLEALTPTLEAALAEAGVTLQQLDAIAVTSGPGLAGALMVGVGAAKAPAIALDTPLYAVNHLVGHVGADVLSEAGPIEYPTVALLVSGGHTSLLLVRDLVSDVELLGETIDDAAGEAF